ncbi:MAG: hypothetical protein IKS98_04535 [Lachnospiraceae bacterium]|nr:hypothetical protein [Lachnospiraceae bacterium]
MSFAVQTSINQSYQYGGYNSNINRRDTDYEKEFMGAATSRTTSSDKGENIGIMTIGDRGFIAKYADSSTEQDPIIKVGDYEVRVNNVDPHNATKIEMFALMSYMDDKGLIENTGMKSFNKMMAYGAQAEYNGFCSGLSDPNAAWTKNRDWTAILKSAKETYFGIPQAYHQGLNCQSIIEGLMRWTGTIRDNNADKSIGDYSEKEWDRMLSDVDQKINEMSNTKAEEVKTSKESFDERISDEKVGLLTARYTTYEKGDTLTDPDTGQPVTFRYVYRTFYSRDGIVSGKSSYDSREGVIKDSCNWEISFKSEDDYERVMNFLDRIPEGDYTKFLTKENFWQDYLNGEIDDDEFFEYYETLDHGKANFIKQDENGNNYIDKEMMNSKYFKYIGIEQLKPVSEPDLQRGLELSALKDRGFDHSADYNKEDIDLFASLREALINIGTDELGFYGEEGAYSINEWIQEIIRRTHMGMMDSLFG